MSARIVVIDDEKAMADMLTAVLESDGYRVYTGYDGQLGMQLVTQHKPDLIVTDVNMPFIHGGRVLEYVRRTPELMQTPVIFLSGAPVQSVYPMVDANSRVAFLRKPLDIEELLSLVRNFLTQYPPSPEK